MTKIAIQPSSPIRASLMKIFSPQARHRWIEPMDDFLVA
jgi:hypothetical protein